jgi:hypothetical protein
MLLRSCGVVYGDVRLNRGWGEEGLLEKRSVVKDARLGAEWAKMRGTSDDSNFESHDGTNENRSDLCV